MVTCLDETLIAPSAHTEQQQAGYQQGSTRAEQTSQLTLWVKFKVKLVLWNISSTLMRINIPAEKENTLLVSGKEAHCRLSLLPW